MSHAELMFCGECGAKVAADARFCAQCGTAQEPLTQAARPGAAPPGPERSGSRDHGSRPGSAPGGWRPPWADDRPAAQRVETALPGLGELAGELAARVSTPVVRAGIAVGAATVAACLAIGFLVAAVAPETSLTGQLGGDGIVAEGLRAAVGLTQASVKVGGEDGGAFSGTLMPLIFAIVPLGAAFFAARAVAPSLAGIPEREAAAWITLGGAVVFAAGQLVVALVANGQGDVPVDFKPASVLVASIILAGSGAAAGSVLGGRHAVPDRQRQPLPWAAARTLQIVGGPLRALATLLVIATIVAVVHSEAAVVTGTKPVPGESTVTAVAEEVLLGANRGVTAVGLGTLSKFRNGALLLPDGDDHATKLAANLGRNETGRIFAYSGALPVYWFLPLLVMLIGATLLAALYGGFATVRRVAPRTQLWAAAYGAVTGIVWALVLAILRSAAHMLTDPVAQPGILGDSLFGSALLVGGVFGAVGGLIAYRPHMPGRQDAAATPAREVAA